MSCLVLSLAGQSPDRSQRIAFVEDQLRVKEVPATTEGGPDIEAVGGGQAVTVLASGVPPLPGPLQDNVKAVLSVMLGMV